MFLITSFLAPFHFKVCAQSSPEELNELFRKEAPIRVPSKDLEDKDTDGGNANTEGKIQSSSGPEQKKSQTREKSDAVKENSTKQKSEREKSSENTGGKLSKTDLAKLGSSFTVFILASSGSTGSGFFISPNLIMTNNHVVTNDDELTLELRQHPEIPVDGPIEEKVDVFTHTGQRKTAKVIARGLMKTGRDFSILEITEAENVTPAKFTLHFEQLQEVYAFGFPGYVIQSLPNMQELKDPFSDNASGIPNVVTSAGVIHVISPVADNSNMEMVFHSAKVEKGNSGGPLIDSCGRVVGINTQITLEKVAGTDNLTVTNPRTGGNEPLKLTVSSGYERALSSNEIIKFLRQKGIKFEISDGACEEAQSKR